MGWGSCGAVGLRLQVNLVLGPPSGATHGGDDDAGRAGVKSRQGRRVPDGYGVAVAMGR